MIKSVKEMINEGWQALGWLPNKSGFEFTGITKDGNKIDCVVKLVDGMHSAYSMDGKPVFKQLAYWRNK